MASLSIWTNVALVLTTITMFNEDVSGLLFFNLHPFKELKNECEIDLDCTSNKCSTRTDFICAARSKFKLIKIWLRALTVRSILFPIVYLIFNLVISMSISLFSDFINNLFKQRAKYIKNNSKYIVKRKKKQKRCQFKVCIECTKDLHCSHMGVKQFCGYHEKCVTCKKNIDCPAGQFCQAGSCQFGDGFWFY